uniref:Uncharacterized protein n=1 Tax=uncultured Microgenomates bacterium Rifle_16ft_4_minimus_22956 TaxID=1665109 RepID=A0A0H4T219_9BACT|nr:hypothetical protein [uncultured Microgenomates bacterium Rifle_16ft_4_minimus_22956]
MIQLRSIINVADNTGASRLAVIQVKRYWSEQEKKKEDRTVHISGLMIMLP